MRETILARRAIGSELMRCNPWCDGFAIDSINGKP
jgi:hypothetical protein